MRMFEGEIGSREDAKMLHPNDIERAARIAVDCGFHIHEDLGPGLLEDAYEALMAEYDVTPELLAADMRSLLTDLVAHGLLVMGDA